MDKRQLVSHDIEVGRKIIEGLDREGIAVDVAAWIRDDDSNIWQLVISSPSVSVHGARPVYESIAGMLQAWTDADSDVALDDIDVVGPDEHVVREIKERVGTNRGLYRIRLHNARVYRAVGGTIDHGARVRIKASGRLGTVRALLPTAQGPRYLVFYDLTSEQLQPLDSRPRPPVGQDFSADDLDFLYVVRTGGWPEKPPRVARPA